jgi:hypothetical protein
MCLAPAPGLPTDATVRAEAGESAEGVASRAGREEEGASRADREEEVASRVGREEGWWWAQLLDPS